MTPSRGLVSRLRGLRQDSKEAEAKEPIAISANGSGQLSPSNEPTILRIIVVGDTGVGKTSLLQVTVHF